MYRFTIYFETRSGYACDVTIEDENWDELLKRASAAIQAIKPLSRQPGQPPDQGQQGIDQQLVAAGQAEESSTKKDSFAPDWCHLHNCRMTKWEKAGRSWYSHQLGVGEFCKGKKSVAA